jgi:dolichol-phosphate mannosyltransferase
MNRTSGHKSTPGAGDFRLVDRSILVRLATITDTHPYVRGLVSSLAVNEIGVPFDRQERKHGVSKFPIRRLISFALEGVVSHSVLPLRLATYIGLSISIVSALLAGFYLFSALLFGRTWPSGFATTTLLLLFGISLNAILLGIIGEYIGRIYLQVRQAQPMVVESTINVELSGTLLES